MRRARSLRLAHILLAGAILGVMLLTSACGGSSQLQEQASQARSKLDQQLQYAQKIGVPKASLQPVIQKEQALNKTSAPFAWFDDGPDNTYYKNQTSSYQQLYSSLQETIAIATGEQKGKAQQALQLFQTNLKDQQTKEGNDLPLFANRYDTDQKRFSKSTTPNDYAGVTQDAVAANAVLGLMSQAYSQLGIFRNTIDQLGKANIDVTAMQGQYNDDLNLFFTATTSKDFDTLNTTLNAQYQLAVVNSIQSLPFIGEAKLQTFQNQLNQLQTYGMDASSYQQLYNDDKDAMDKAKTINDYFNVSNKIDADIASMHDDMVKGASNYLILQLDKEAKDWGNAHLYHDNFDGHDYIVDSGYTMDGIGYWLQRENSWSWTTDDYQSVVDDDNNEFFNFQMFQQDYADKTPADQVHQTDLELMQHYPSMQHGTVIIVSMAQQSLHFFVDGKMTNAFLITTGRVERPTLPGLWTTQDRKAPTEFKSDDPPSSPFWYPPTKINYAILYHWGGFFVHDSWWRADYGPGTNFPHYDSGGDESFSGNGSHGCVNVREDQASWLYSNTDYNTQILIY